ncbi:hypothetical protein Acr_03g0019360 [Actinidia rufa]|uniref:Heavy metal transport/detoxification superfamily protein n=1 Tax=Actinidia rufa TaxID=165716 RepID=A0A7J0EFM9_9ERIC|nr:hypothetical protein Acr_03g0019360 [Actinidia rufa]
MSSGVYKTEIDPSQPKVIIVGNVDAQTLIRKLLKVGKQAEIWSNENQTAGKVKKELEARTTKELDKEKQKPAWEKAKCSDVSATATVKIKERANGPEGDINKSSKRDQESTNYKASTLSRETERTKIERTLPHQEDVTCIPGMFYDKDKVRADAQHCYMVEPYTTALPYYAIHSYQAPLLSSTCCNREHCNCGGPVCQTLVQMPAAKVGDYFSDENTSGCLVM